MILLICGGRNYIDYNALVRAMDTLAWTPEIIIEGGARGADTLARVYAIKHGIQYVEVPALWSTHGKGAGPIRNEAMLKLKPDYCLALPGGSGTADMIHRCKLSGVPVWEPYQIN